MRKEWGVSVEQGFQLCRLRSQERWCLVIAVSQCECMFCPWTVHLKWSKWQFYVYFIITTTTKQRQRNIYCIILMLSNSKPQKPLMFGRKANLIYIILWFPFWGFDTCIQCILILFSSSQPYPFSSVISLCISTFLSLWLRYPREQLKGEICTAHP